MSHCDGTIKGCKYIHALKYHITTKKCSRSGCLKASETLVKKHITEKHADYQIEDVPLTSAPGNSSSETKVTANKSQVKKPTPETTTTTTTTSVQKQRISRQSKPKVPIETVEEILDDKDSKEVFPIASSAGNSATAKQSNRHGRQNTHEVSVLVESAELIPSTVEDQYESEIFETTPSPKQNWRPQQRRCKFFWDLTRGGGQPLHIEIHPGFVMPVWEYKCKQPLDDYDIRAKFCRNCQYIHDHLLGATSDRKTVSEQPQQMPYPVPMQQAPPFYTQQYVEQPQQMSFHHTQVPMQQPQSQITYSRFTGKPHQVHYNKSSAGHPVKRRYSNREKDPGNTRPPSETNKRQQANSTRSATTTQTAVRKPRVFRAAGGDGSEPDEISGIDGKGDL